MVKCSAKMVKAIFGADTQFLLIFPCNFNPLNARPLSIRRDSVVKESFVEQRFVRSSNTHSTLKQI